MTCWGQHNTSLPLIFPMAIGRYIAMHPKSQEKTAFTTHEGLHEFCVMPFCLKNALSAKADAEDANGAEPGR